MRVQRVLLADAGAADGVSDLVGRVVLGDAAHHIGLGQPLVGVPDRSAGPVAHQHHQMLELPERERVGRARGHRAHHLRRERQVVPDDPVLEEILLMRAEHSRHDLAQRCEEEGAGPLCCFPGLAANPVGSDMDLQDPAGKAVSEIIAEFPLTRRRLLR